MTPFRQPRHALAIGALAVAIGLTYAGALGNGFTFDDHRLQGLQQACTLFRGELDRIILEADQYLCVACQGVR